MRHDNGAPLVRIYGPRTIGMRVGTVAFNLLDPDGKLIDSDHVQAAATAANISLHRTAGELPNRWRPTLDAPTLPVNA